MDNYQRALNGPDAVALLSALRQGELTVEQLERSHLARLDQVQPQVNGATQIFRDDALARARQLDATGDRSLPLFGRRFERR